LSVHVYIHRRGGTSVFRPEGELDIEAAASLRDLLDEEIDRGGRDIVLSLARVTFIDSSGLGVILGRYRRLTDLGGTMTLAAVPEIVRPVLELSGLLTLLPVVQVEVGGRG